MIDSNPSEMLLCSGRLFERGMKEEEIQHRQVCVCVCVFLGSQMMSSVKAP